MVLTYLHLLDPEDLPLILGVPLQQIHTGYLDVPECDQGS